MKNLLFLLLLTGFAFMSCDGRKSKSMSLKEAVEEFNKKQMVIETINYYPESYTEVVTDTILSNKVKIHIKNYSLTNEGIVMSASQDISTKTEKQHRIFESEIVITTPTKEILNTHISAEQFKSRYADSFWKNATLQHVWVNQDLSTSEDIQLDISFINPTDNSYKLYRMSVDENGQQQINLIEERT